MAVWGLSDFCRLGHHSQGVVPSHIKVGGHYDLI